MKAIDAYRDLTKELDKYESPTFTIRDFNYFFSKAISVWIEDNYKKLDVIQKDVDDLRSVIKTNHLLTVNPTTMVATLPTDYRHILSVRLTIKYKVQTGVYAADSTRIIHPLRLKSGQKGFRFERNAYHRPNQKRYYYEIYGTTIEFHLDENIMAPNNANDNLEIDYIREPDVVYLNPDKQSDYNQTANNSVLFYNTGATPNVVYYEIINVARMLFLENIESRRSVEATRQAAIQ